jgi:hypothetical protein
LSSVLNGLDLQAPSRSAFVERWQENIRQSGRSPGKVAAGFVGAWLAFALVLYVLPRPAGLGPAGQATLAVMVWACMMWITEAIPVGVSGLLIPMLLAMTGAARPFPVAAGGFTTPVVFLCLAAFLFALVMEKVDHRRTSRLRCSTRRWRDGERRDLRHIPANMVLSLIIPAWRTPRHALLPVWTDWWPGDTRGAKSQSSFGPWFTGR